MATKKAFEKPEAGYAGLKADELSTLSDLALDEYAELNKIADDEVTDEQIDRMIELKTEITAIKAEVTAQAEAAEARAAKLADAKTPLDEEGGDEDEEEADEEEADAEEEEADEAEVPEKEDALVASGAKKTVVRRAVNRRKRVAPEEDEKPAGRSVAITAQADVRGFSGGQELTMDTAVEAFMNRVKGMPRGRVGKGGQISSYGVATFTKSSEPRYADFAIDTKTSDSEAWRNIMNASKESNLPTTENGENALIAAGGWCAPSENFYDLCQWETSTGALDLPEITVVRGGINFTKGPDFSDIYTNTGFLQTEAQAEAGTAKTFLEVDCPDWTEIRLDAIGYGVKAPILTASPAGFPELVRRYLEGALVAHFHKVNAYVIGKVVTALGSVQDFGELGSASGDLLNAIEISAQSLRYKFRLGENATLEAFFPMWIQSALRADLARRTGVDMLAVTNQQINSWFALRGIRPQFVYDWSGQDLAGTEVQFPSSVRFGMYPAGAFVKGTNNIISLDAIYDSTEITTNPYTAAFFEEAILVANTCGSGRIFQVGLDYHGRTGAATLGLQTAS